MRTVLISAHEFSPFLGSECGMGWNLVMELSRYNKVIVCYAASNQFKTEIYQDHIKKYQLTHKLPFEAIPIPQPRVTLFIARINLILSRRTTGVGFSPLYWIGVYFWERRLYTRVKKLMKAIDVDLIHHLNHISFRETGFLWKIDKPFILGPISGFVKTPRGYSNKFNRSTKIANWLRNTANDIQSQKNRFKKSVSRAKHVFYVSPEDYNSLEGHKKKLSQLLDVATNPDESFSYRERKKHDLLKILVVGRIDNLKNLETLILSISDPDLLDKISLTIAGEGSKQEFIKTLAQKNNIKNIVWLGQISREEVKKYMKNHDLLVHLSIKEATSSAILEALSNGLPVLCHDAFGGSIAVNNLCGFKIPLIDPRTTIEFTIKILKSIIENPKILDDKRKGAFLRSKELTWSKSAKEINRVYQHILFK